MNKYSKYMTDRTYENKLSPVQKVMILKEAEEAIKFIEDDKKFLPEHLPDAGQKEIKLSEEQKEFIRYCYLNDLSSHALSIIGKDFKLQRKIKPEEILSDENYDYLRHETDETLGDVLSVVLWDMKTYYPPETVQTWREILLSRPDAEKHYIQNAIDVCEDYIRFEQGNSLNNGTQKSTQF